MARKSNSFIKFKDILKEDTGSSTISVNENHVYLLNLAIGISVDSSRLLDNISSKKDFIRSKSLAIQLQKSLELLLEKIEPSPVKGDFNQKDLENFKTLKPSEYPSYVKKVIEIKKMSQKEYDEHLNKVPAPSGYSNVVPTSYSNAIGKQSNGRALHNGGMAPPKEWKSITELNLKSSEKDRLIEEMRKLNEQGKTVTKTKISLPINVNEFTEPFKYLENIHDYNGSFLITLLKSLDDIKREEASNKVDLRKVIKKILNGEVIILSVYDIKGLISEGEEKKFLIVLIFDKLNGVLKSENIQTIFQNGKTHELSKKQLTELNKFFISKKIN
jgi:hypothetical protein